MDIRCASPIDGAVYATRTAHSAEASRFGPSSRRPRRAPRATCSAIRATPRRRSGRGAALSRLGYLSLTRPKSWHLKGI